MLDTIMNVNYIEATSLDFICIIIIEGQGFTAIKTEI